MRRFVLRLILGIIAFAVLWSLVLSGPEFDGIWKSFRENAPAIPGVVIPDGGGGGGLTPPGVKNGGKAPETAPFDSATATAVLGKIVVAPSDSQDGYLREDFLKSWPSIDGCTVRNSVLKRDLTNVSLKNGGKDCVVESGHLDDPYSTRSINFTVSKPSAVQIDHVIPLSWAYKNGAQGWPEDSKKAFAIDAGNLLAVDGPTNQSKSDSGPADWPSDRVWNDQAAKGNIAELCNYVSKFTGLAVQYGLTMNELDHGAVSRRLQSCA